jgi:hypothetical protein
MKLNKLSQVLLAAACLTGGAAYANEISFTNSNTVMTQDTDLADLLSFQQFDPTLGTLTSIKIEVGSHVDGAVHLENGLADERSIPVSLSVDLFLQRPDNSYVISLLGNSLFNTSLGLNGYGTADLSNSINLYSSTTLFGASDLSLFQGNGFLLAPLAVNANALSSGDDVDVAFTTTANGYGTITYTYTAAVPEPETYGMLLLGLGVMAFVSKRKARSAQA